MVRKLKLKDSIYILKESEEIYDVIFTGTRKTKKFRVDSLVKKLIAELDIEQTREELLSRLKHYYDEELGISKKVARLKPIVVVKG